MKPLIYSTFFILSLGLAGSVLAEDERLEKLTTEHRKWLEEEVVYIITDDERDFFLNLSTVEERERFIEAFWERRDPDPATLENEFKVEHYRRIDYANYHYGREAPKPGWRTDRGKYYIILGPPQSTERFYGYNEVVESELWLYTGDTNLGLPPRFNLLFFREEDVGDYKLYSPVGDGPERLLKAGMYYQGNQNRAVDVLEVVSMDLARASLTVDLTEPTSQHLSGRNTRDPLELTVRPPMNVQRVFADIVEAPKKRVDTSYLDAYLRYGDKVSAEYSFKYVPSRASFAVLTGPKDTRFVHYAVEIEPKNFSLATNEDETLFNTTLDISLEVRDEQGNLIALDDNTIYIELTASQLEQAQAYPFAYQGNYPVVIPGTFKASVTVRNRVTKQFTVAEGEVVIPPYDGKPRLDDLVVGYHNELVAGAGESDHLVFQLGLNRIHPSADHVFAIGETVHVLSEVHGAEPDALVRLALRNGEETVDTLETQVSKYHGGPVMEKLSLLGIQGGNYELRAQLVDASGQTLDQESIPLTVSPRSIIPRPAVIYRRAFNTEIPGLLSLRRGEQLLHFGAYVEAQAEFAAAVDANNPDLPAARWGLAKSLLYTREPDKTLELLLPMEEAYAAQYEVMEGIGLAYYFKQDYQKSVEYLEKAIALRAPDTSVLNALGDGYQSLGRPDEAKTVFERSLSLNPDQTGVKQRLASLSQSGAP